MEPVEKMIGFLVACKKVRSTQNKTGAQADDNDKEIITDECNEEMC